MRDSNPRSVRRASLCNSISVGGLRQDSRRCRALARQSASMHNSIRLTSSTEEVGPALMRISTRLSPAEICRVISAEYQVYGGTLLTKLVGAAPTPSKVCQLKLPLVVVW